MLSSDTDLRRVAVTGIGCVTPFGPDVKALVRGVSEGECALGPARRIDTSGFRCTVVGEVRDEWLNTPFRLDWERCLALSWQAAREALASAGLEQAPAETTLALGTTAGEMGALEALLGPKSPDSIGRPVLGPPCSITRRLAIELGAAGRNTTFVNACIASANAIASAFDLIRSGQTAMAIAGGTEVLTRSSLAGFNTLHALSPTFCRPFDTHRDGTQLSEASAFVVLEEFGAAKRADHGILCEMLGYGISSDAFHPTRSDPEGAGSRRAIERALVDADRSPDDVDFISAHGTGTYQNDLAELHALSSVLGKRLKDTPISSLKSQMGHSTGASGAMDFVLAVLAINTGLLPPSVHLDTPIPEFADCDFVIQHGRRTRIRTVLSNSFAFGGNNISIVLGQA